MIVSNLVPLLIAMFHIASCEIIYTIRGTVDTNDPKNKPFNCSKILTPILEKRKLCKKQTSTEVDICTVFAEDYHFMIPFLIHHLSIGFEKIHVYNNDLKSSWYLHPTVLCLSAADLITIVPWPGDGEFLNGLNHCHRARVLERRGYTYGKDLQNRQLWMAIFDIDEMLVLHPPSTTDNSNFNRNLVCINSLLDEYPGASQIGINWAMYVPVAPFSDYAIFGNPQQIPPHHKEKLLSYDRANDTIPLVILPHDMLHQRMRENYHVKSIARPNCVSKISSPHYMEVFETCPFDKRMMTLSRRKFPLSSVTTGIEKPANYKIAQLNHYWSTSVEDFLRKVHRGRGIKQAGIYRNSADLPVRSQGPMVTDTVFHDIYGAYFNELKRSCPECFDLSVVLPAH